MTHVQKERDTSNNDQSMEYSVLMNQKTVCFININGKPIDCRGTYFVKDFDGNIKQIQSFCKLHFFAVLRRCLHAF